MKKNVPLALALLIGLLMIAAYYFPWLDGPYRLILQWTAVIWGFAFFLGILSFLMHHIRKVKKKREGWGFSITAITAFSIMVLAGLLPKALPSVFGFLGSWNKGPDESVFRWLFINMLV
ncbi:MAG: hypothetical protein ACYTDY_03825, partial [Planctomycetota bacterium]